MNRGNADFTEARNSEYVDKSGLIAVVNSTLFTRQKFSCVTRCRRFGKSMAAQMLAAYYDQSCNSRSLFADLQIASHPSFENHLNKYPVIYIDITDFTTRDNLQATSIVATIQKEVMAEVHAVYPDAVIAPEDDLMAVLTKTAMHYGMKFIMIIDEWDAICREAPEALDRYINLLRRMFKGSLSAQAFAGVYMTGILPIKKFKTQSALNNFREYSMVEPRNMAGYFGFTKDEVVALAQKYRMDFDELEKWYDGYQIGDDMSMFNPNSVVQAIDAGCCRSFWAATGSFDAVTSYIAMNFDGLKDDIICMLGGGRVKVNPTKFQNDLSIVRSKDDVLTVLIHLGYLSFDWRSSECYVPNKEVGDELVSVVEENKWELVAQSIEQSGKLLEATLRGDSDYVARALRSIHCDETSIFSYNDENSLACVISLAYYSARNDHHIHREYPAGEGYANLVLIPRKNISSPALVIELKYNKNAQAAISQIRSRLYPQTIASYTGDILLVGISYDRKSKQHHCQIERWQKN